MLSDQVDRLTARVRLSRSSSLADLQHPQSQDLPGITMSGNEDGLAPTTKDLKPRTCHKCHCPLTDPYHAGVKSGVDHCTLDHWSGCLGDKPAGRDGNGSMWAACPSEVSDDEEKSTDLEDFENGNGDDHGSGSQLLPGSVKEAADMLANHALNMGPGFGHRDSSSSSSDSSDEEELQIRREELEKLKQQMAKVAKEKKKADKKEKKRLEMEKVEMEKQALLKLIQASTAPHVSAELASENVQPTHKSGNKASKALKEKAAQHAAKQQQREEERARAKQVTGLTMPGIRSLPSMTPEVEQYLRSLQTTIPSLAKEPTAPVGPGPIFQPLGVYGSQPEGHGDNEEVAQDYVFVAKLGKLVKVVQRSPQRTGFGKSGVTPSPQPLDSGDDSVDDTSEDEDCPLRPEAGYRFIWKRDSKGRKYFVSERVRQTNVETNFKYVYDKDTGRTYREEVSCPQMLATQSKPRLKKNQVNVTPVQQKTFVDHRQTHGNLLVSASSQQSSDERMPTFLAAENDRQGRDTKTPEIVQVARNCPVSWTDKITMDKLNVVLFAWSYVSTLLAARTGMAPDLEQGELEARLQHLLHVLEVTLQTSSQSDYTGDSWKVARLYHTKVQHKVDSRQASWVQLTTMHHNATLPHELMASMQELANKPKPRGGDGNGKDRFTDKNIKRDKKTCLTWNRSEVRGKCSWETEHPGEKCKYTHECSWCKSKNFTQVTHQRFFCQKRREADED